MELFYEPLEILHNDFDKKFDNFIRSTIEKINTAQGEQKTRLIEEYIEEPGYLGMALVSYLSLAVATGSSQSIVRFFSIIYLTL